MHAQHAKPSNIPARLTRQEWSLLGAEIGALFLLFIIAFTGRDAFGEQIKQLLTVLSALAGALGAGAGAWIAWRGVISAGGRWQRLLLGGVMTFFGVYSVIHVLS